MKTPRFLPLAPILILAPLAANAQSGEKCGIFAFDQNQCGVHPKMYVYNDIVCHQEFAAYCRSKNKSVSPSIPKRRPAAVPKKELASRPAAKKAALTPAQPETAAPDENAPLTDSETALLTAAEKASCAAGHDAAKYRALARSRAGYKAPANAEQFAALNPSQKELFCDQSDRSPVNCAGASGPKKTPALDSLVDAKADAGTLDGTAVTCSGVPNPAAAWAADACRTRSAQKPVAKGGLLASAPPPPSAARTDETRAETEGAAPAAARGRAAAPAVSKSVVESKEHKGPLRQIASAFVKVAKWLW